ncbi:homoserine kinase type II [Methylopila capsulata]|uniref:Homoserine kinase n=1 Tax=Methylopila capsulata TaxID=61654 RepID=A0A9W6IX51_9HYPH|nr:homoserine kinase [Methylopila capsulata]MBM7852706.1 homoserine kinase type II [Methylopila capsulata]GLK56915.1 homoserine kinase [Methylopila capsulata]
MAVYTEVPDEDLAAFLKAYDIGEAVSFKGIAEGVENTNYLLVTTKARFILTLYEKRVNRDDLPFFLGLLEHLAARGVTCPQPVAARDGALLSELCGRPAALVTFLDGVSVRRPTPRQCAELGRALADLHEAAKGFELKRPNALSVEGWRRLAESARGRSDAVAPGLDALIAAELAALGPTFEGLALPSGVIHADLFPNNVFFLGDRLSGLIDFYFACDDAFAYDVAICLNAWCFETTGEFNVTKGRALLDAYHAARPLSEAETAALPALARGAALRFMLTRLVDWLDTPPGALVKKLDPLEYLKKLRFHQQAAGLGDYGWRP